MSSFSNQSWPARLSKFYEPGDIWGEKRCVALTGIGSAGVDAVASIRLECVDKIQTAPYESMIFFDCGDRDAVLAARQYAADAKIYSNGNVFTVAVATGDRAMVDDEFARGYFDQVIFVDKHLLHEPADFSLRDMIYRGFIGIDSADVLALQRMTPYMEYIEVECDGQENFPILLNTLQKKTLRYHDQCAGMFRIQGSFNDVYLERIEEITDSIDLSDDDVILWQMRFNEDEMNYTHRISVSALIGDIQSTEDA